MKVSRATPHRARKAAFPAPLGPAGGVPRLGVRQPALSHTEECWAVVMESGPHRGLLSSLHFGKRPEYLGGYTTATFATSFAARQAAAKLQASWGNPRPRLFRAVRVRVEVTEA